MQYKTKELRKINEKVKLKKQGVKDQTVIDFSAAKIEMEATREKGEKQMKKISTVKLFGIEGVIAGYKEGKADFARPEWLKDVVLWLQYFPESPLYLSGNTGTGKTFVVKEVFKALGYSVNEINAHGRTTIEDFIGQWTLKDGNTVFVEGLLADAFENGKAFVVNEYDLMTPDVMGGLNTILDGSDLTLPDGRVLKKNPMFRFVATANTGGTGDNKGLFAGTNTLNIAAMDRFIKIEAAYLDKETEKDLLVKEGLPYDMVQSVQDFAESLRLLFDTGSCAFIDGNLSLPVSIRTLLRMSRLAANGVDMHKAINLCLLNGASDQDKVVVKEVAARFFGEE